MSWSEVDLFIIGGGSGGVRAARIAASYGARVLIAEEYRVGGTCVIRGCVPKKLMVYASHIPDEMRDAVGFGWTISSTEFDWATLIANKNSEIARLEAAYTTNLEKSGVRVVKARAQFEDAHCLRLSSGEIVRAKYILIATGGAPDKGAAFPGIEHVISSNEVFDLPNLPRRVLVQGGGYIAVEFACIFAGLGSEVTLAYRGDNILRGFDEDVRLHVRGELEKSGIKLLMRSTVAKVERCADQRIVCLSGGSRVLVDEVLFAIGRRPNIQGLGLEKAGVALNPVSGAVLVNNMAQTSVPHIFAIGDVTDRINLTPVAVREGQAFADRVFGARSVEVDYGDVPTAVFSQPQIGAVGLTEAQARDRFPLVDIYKTTFKPLKATLSGSASRTLMKLVVDASTGRILGCHVVSPDAAEIVQMAAVAIRMKATKEDFDSTMALHPTSAEELVTMREPFARHVRQGEEKSFRSCEQPDCALSQSGHIAASPKSA
jgi:glutathione reductase (NADPH)